MVDNGGPDDQCWLSMINADYERLVTVNRGCF